MITSSTKYGPTPNGGVKSIAFYTDEEGRPTNLELATFIKIVEFDENDEQIAETFMNKS